MTGSPSAAPSTSAWRSVAPPALGPVLSASLQVFLEKGFHGASVREIAQRAELTVPTLYYHHDSKEGLLLALLNASLEPIAEAVEAAAAEGVAPHEKLSNIVECIVLWMTVDAANAAIDSTESRYLSPSNHERYVVLRDRVEKPLQDVLTAGSADGSFRIDDISETRRAILGMTQTIPRWYAPGGKSTPEMIAARYTTLVLRMVGYEKTAG